MLRVMISLYCLLLASSATATTIEVRYLDEPGEGAFDETPLDPLPTNPGTTLGEQRRYAHDYAVSLLERMVWIDNRWPVYSDVSFHRFGVPGSSAIARDETGLLSEQDGYRISDLLFAAQNPGLADPVTTRGESPTLITTYDPGFEFDLTVGESLAAASPIPGLLVSTAMHEFVHGFGFVSHVTDSGFISSLPPYQEYVYEPSLFDHHVRHVGATPDRPEDMIQEQLDALLTAGDNARWVGSATSAAAGRILTSGREGGEVFLFAPNSFNGAALSHLSDTVRPYQLMSTSSGGTTNLGIAAYMLSDMGWGPVIDSSVTAAPTGQDRVQVEVNTDATAEQLLVNLHLPEGVSVEDTTASPATCETTGQTTACRYTRLNGAGSIQYTLTGTPGFYDVAADVDHQALHVDPIPVNNFAVAQQVQVGENTIQGVTLDPGQVAEAQPVGTLVGNFQVTSPADIDHTFALATGGEHNACFRIEDDRLLTTTELDYEALSELDIRIETTASNGFTRQDNLTVEVTDVATAGLLTVTTTAFAGDGELRVYDLRWAGLLLCLALMLAARRQRTLRWMSTGLLVVLLSSCGGGGGGGSDSAPASVTTTPPIQTFTCPEG